MLLTLVSCGSDNKSSGSQEQNAVCENCITSANWKILLPGRSFPDKSRVDINGTTVLNECVSKQKYMINRSSDPQELYLDNFYVPKRGELKINIVDLGSDCDSESTFFENSNVEFEETKGAGGTTELLINL